MKEIKKIEIHKFVKSERMSKEDLVAVEEPLEMRLVYENDGEEVQRSVAVTMRTPGRDEDLVRGFFVGEKIISSDAIQKIELGENIVSVFTKPGVSIPEGKFSRNFFMTSSCGVCGKAALDDLVWSGFSEIEHAHVLSVEMIMELPNRSREKQQIFHLTGGLHAAAAYSLDGELLEIAEDVGRHNAFDKLLGSLDAKKHPFGDTIVLLSGRISFELVQKAVSFGVPFLAAVGAPSSLAIETAETFGISLAGFVNEERLNIYTGFENFR